MYRAESKSLRYTTVAHHVLPRTAGFPAPTPCHCCTHFRASCSYTSKWNEGNWRSDTADSQAVHLDDRRAHHPGR